MLPAIALKVRRVVTDHDAGGRSVVAVDGVCGNVISRRPGHASCVAWSNEQTTFRIVEYQPGVAPRNHRTETVDYAVVLSGEIDMELEGAVVHLAAGDVLVQQNTMHNWVNRGAEPCVIAFVLLSAKGAKGAVG
jgi:mannose-6-phosphate isomerase-like protein (cupin superfamily)